MDANESSLSGVRVLDLATVLAAPVAATFLGDFGAEVVKVEDPNGGDFTRLGAGGDRPGRRSLHWVQEGRNKQSVTIDLRTSGGRDLVRSLVPHFDVVVLNFRPPTLEKWGLTPQELQEINPRAVILCVTGYGLTGPYRERGAFDRIASAFSGLTHVSGEEDGPAVRSGYSVIDYMAAYLAAFATVSALYHRDLVSGVGQIVDLGLYEAGFRASENALLAYGAYGKVRGRTGNRNPGIAPASDFATADGRTISLHAGTDALFERLAAVMGAPELAEDPRFARATDRVAHQDELYPLVATWAATLDSDEAVAALNRADVPAAPLMDISDIADDPHYRERGTVVTIADQDHGELPMAGPIPRLSRTPASIRNLGPGLGEHTDEVLEHFLGRTSEELAELRAQGVI